MRSHNERARLISRKMNTHIQPSLHAVTAAAESMSTTSKFRVAPLVLYEGDFLNRLFARIDVGPRKPVDIVKRCLLLLAVTWLPMALLAIYEGYYKPPLSANFFADFAAYAQFFIGLPLFVLAEGVVIRATSDAGVEFATSGVLRHARKLTALDGLHRQIARLKDARWIDVTCLLTAYYLSGWIIGTELLRHGPVGTWHTKIIGEWRVITWTGVWAFGVAIPLLNYWWLRHVGRVLIWGYYLYRVSRLRLDLVPTHPDRTGGIGFISEVQGHFAWVIFAYGITNVAATVGYELVVLKVSPWLPPVWGPVLGFVVGAPLLFTLPLFLFTRQLAITKLLAKRRYRKLLMEQTRVLEGKVLPLHIRKNALPTAADVTLVTQLSQLFDRVQSMRVVPFDFRSMTQLVASSLGSIVSLLPLLHIEGAANAVLEALVKILERIPFAH